MNNTEQPLPSIKKERAIAEEAIPTNLPQSPTLRLTPWRIAIFCGLAILTIGLLLTLGGGRTTLVTIRSAKWEWLILALAIHYSGFGVRGLRWQQLLRLMGYRLTWRYSTSLLISGWFISALLPARAGDWVRVGILRMADDSHPPIPVADSLGSIVLERTVDLSALMVLGTSAGFLLLRTGLDVPIWILWAYGIACTAVIGVIGAILLMPAILKWLQAIWQQPLWQRALHFAIDILQSLRAFGRHPRVALLIMIESLYIWLCDAIVMWFVLKALGVTTLFSTITFVALTVDIFAAIPFTPGGIGQIEAANTALLALLPLTSLQIAAAVLINRAISYWSFLLFSGFVTFATGMWQLMPRLSDGFGNVERANR